MIAHEYGEPFSLVMSRAISSARPWMVGESDDRICGPLLGRHARSTRLSSKAARAAATALSMSAVVPSGTWPTFSSVDGEITSITPVPAGATQSPPMYRRSSTGMRAPLCGRPSG